MPSALRRGGSEPVTEAGVRRIDVLGLGVDVIGIDSAIGRILARAADPASPPAIVVKPYVEFYERLGDPRVTTILDSAWLSLADGVALQWAAAYLRSGRRGPAALVRSLAGIVTRPASVATVLPERFAGVTFTLPLLERAAAAGLAVFLVGTPKHGSIEATASHLRERIPGLRIAGAAPGNADAASAAALLERLRATRPDLVLVGMGFPRQELLMAALAPRLGHGVLIGEGGTFDYRELGGTIVRAPALIRRLGLEWLWRLLREPSRLRRQLAIPRFILRVQRAAGRAESPRR